MESRSFVMNLHPFNLYIQSYPTRTQSENRWQVSLNDFNLLTVIGRGSYAKVFVTFYSEYSGFQVIQAEHKKTKQIYAIKIIKKQMFNEDEVFFYSKFFPKKVNKLIIE